jgi:hypothetical protein
VKPTRLDYCQYLLVSQINYTLTNFADHSEEMSHDAINRYLKNDRVTGSDVWRQVKGDVVHSSNAYVVFDDTVLDKNHSRRIELVRRQYSGNAHGLIKGIGVVNCVYVNPELDKYWIIDFRLYDPDGDGKTKLDHVEEMLNHVVRHKCLPFAAVLMDTWYATRQMMRFIESLHLVYYCPLKANRLVDETDGREPYRHVSALTWPEDEMAVGKLIKIKDFPKGHRVKLFRLVVSTHRTDYVVTNDVSQNSSLDVDSVCAWRWKIEQFHREAKQLTGFERCQCRKARIQRNHIACAFLVWARLAQVARNAKETLYKVKQGLLDDYLRTQLKRPRVLMSFA